MKTQTMRIAFLVFFAALTTLFVAITWPFAKAAFLAFTLTVIFFPFYRFLLKKFKLPRYLTSVLTTLVIGICVIIPLALMGTIIVTKIGHFLQSMVAQSEGASFTDTIKPFLTVIQSWIDKFAGSAPSIEDLQSALTSSIKEAALKFYALSPRVISTTVSIITNYFLMLLFLVVFFAEGGNIYDWFMETAPLSEDHRYELAHDVRIAITSSIIAAILIAIVQGTLLGLGFKVAGFAHSFSWGLIATILCLIPVIGAASCYVTASVLLFSSGNTYGSLIFLIFGFGVISTIDNVIRSLVIRGKARMHPLLLFVTLIGSVKLLGPIGLVVGPVLLAIFLASLRIYRREFAGVEGPI